MVCGARAAVDEDMGVERPSRLLPAWLAEREVVPSKGPEADQEPLEVLMPSLAWTASGKDLEKSAVVCDDFPGSPALTIGQEDVRVRVDE
mmetsp:Transcript_93861/g.205464  ORF Transcript_93861/g.205464 Transcript_93861/m.205464 type:complete len:90 (-) Transcript_93861:179-448(-)